MKSATPERQHRQFEILLAEYLSFIESITPLEGFSDRAKVMALSMAKPALPVLGSISGAFYLSVRTFQRRLVAEGTNYTAIIKELREQMCKLLIRHQRFSIGDISEILGYSERQLLFCRSRISTLPILLNIGNS